MVISDDDSLNGLNIEDCDGTSCGYTTCKNGGICIPNDEGFLCQCPPVSIVIILHHSSDTSEHLYTHRRIM